MIYLIRSVKYFIKMCVLAVILICIMIALGVTSANINIIFKDGYNSVLQLAGILALFSLIYPKFGYTKKIVVLPGESAETTPIIEEFMDSKGYVIHKQQDDTIVFVHRSPIKRAFRFWDDQVTVTKYLSGYQFEGLRRDVVVLVFGFKHRINSQE